MRRVVSKVPRNEYGSSPPVILGGAATGAGACADDPESSEGRDAKVGPDAEFGASVYAGGGSLEGTVKAFMPTRSGRRVAGEGFVSGLGLLRPGCKELGIPVLSVGPRNEGVVGVWRSEFFVEAVSDRCEDLLLLCPIFRNDPKSDRPCLSGGGTVHGFEVGMIGDIA